MFGLKEKPPILSIQGKLLDRLLKENDDWVVISEPGKLINLYSAKCKVFLCPRMNGKNKEVGFSFNQAPYVWDGFDKRESEIFCSRLYMMIQEIKNNKVINGLRGAINLLSSTEES